MAREIPPGDDRERFLCKACKIVHYENPKVVAGCIPEWGERILMCRRAIEPCSGQWTLPAGYLENGETVAEAAKRETYEEAGARVEKLTPYALLNLTFVNQVYVMLRGSLVDAEFRPGHESLEVKFMTEHEIPWDAIAFSSIRQTLLGYFQDRRANRFSFHMWDVLPGV